jgi:hypothetical protein
MRWSESRASDAIVRLLLLLALVTACAGCVGFSLEIPSTHEVRNPVPTKAQEGSFGAGDKLVRWACQSASEPSVPLTKSHFRDMWGEPGEKLATAKGESWIYAEGHRWCGLWAFVVLPVPALLPMCDTYDKVSFEGDVAVSSSSRRFRGLTMGVGAHPYGFFAFMSRPGRVTESKPQVFVFPEREKGDLACPAPRPPA